MKPEGVSQEDWDAAMNAATALFTDWEGPDSGDIAKAIMAAEKRGEEREREACARIGDTLGVLGGATPNPYADWKGHADNIAAAIRNRGKP